MNQTPIPLFLAVEDALSEAVLRRCLDEFQPKFEIIQCLRQDGFGYLKKNIAKFTQIAKQYSILVLIDLDNSPCAVEKVKTWLAEKPQHPNFIFRVAVREVEAWLLADAENLGNFLGISSQVFVGQNPDTLPNPKEHLIQTVHDKCRKRRLRESIVPAPGATSKVGPDYNGVLIQFVESHWKPLSAQEVSESFRRTYQRLQDFKQA